MASIVDYLPKKSQEKYKSDVSKVEKSFNLPSGTIQKVASRSGGGGGSRSVTRQPTTTTQPTSIDKVQQVKPEQAVPVNPYIKALTAREQLTQMAAERGKPFTRLQSQRFLRERGVSITDLRDATRAGRSLYNKTGQNIFEQIKKNVKDERTQDKGTVIDKYGYSIKPEYQKEFIPNLNKIKMDLSDKGYQVDQGTRQYIEQDIKIDPRRFMTLEQLSKIPISQGGTAPEIQRAPSRFQQIKQRFKQYGVAGGTIQSIKEEAQRLEDIRQQKTGDFSRGRETIELAGLGAEAATFTVAPELFLARGIETVSTPRGREQLKQQSIELQEQGVSPTVSKIIPYVEPALDIGFGGIGAGSRAFGKFKGIQSARETALLESAPSVSNTIRIKKTPEYNLDIIAQKIRTQPSKFDKQFLRIPQREVTTIIKQPSVEVGGVTILKSGKGVSVSKAPGELDVALFETSGYAQKLKSTPKYTQQIDGRRVSMELEGYSGSIGDIKTTVQARGSVKSSYNIMEGGRIEGTGEVGKSLAKSTEPLQLSVSKKTGENLFYSVGAKPKELNINLATGETSLRFKPSSKGIVKVIRPKSSDLGVLKFQGKGKKSSPDYLQNLYDVSPESQLILGKVKSNIIKQNIIKPKIIEPIKTPKVTTIAPTEQKTTNQISTFYGTGQYEKQEAIDMQMPLSIKSMRIDTTTKTGQAGRTILFPKTKSSTKTIQKMSSEVITKTILDTKQENKLKQDIKSLLIPKQEIINKNIFVNIPGQIFNVPKEKIKTKAIIPAFFKFKTKKPKKPLKSKSKKEKELFFAITKRYGKEKIIAVGKTVKEAKSKGERKVLRTLGATLKVKTSKGKQVELKPTKLFRKSKTDPLAIVQRKSTPLGGRLATKGERKEILSLRRSKI